MTLSVIITAGVTAYDCSDYVVLHSVEIDEQLFNPESFKPNTNKAVLRLHRTCPYIDEIFAADGDISIAITADAIPVFSGYLTDNYTLKITARGGSDVELTAEDPGIRLLKKPWASTGGLYTSFSGKKVCDSADSANSFVHILAALAGVTVSSTVPTISDLLYFSVEDKSKSQYWDILEGVLFDFRHTFYFDASGELCLFAFGGLTGTPSTIVRSDATILQKSLGDAGIEVKKRFIQYREAVINYKEGELVSSAVVFRDTTGQGLTDCDIEIAAGGYYPTSCDASTYSYIDYFLEDGRDILAVTSATADFVVDTGITYEFTHIGKSAQIRFYNPTALPKHIRKLRVTGLNVYAIKADSTMTSNEGGGKKLEYEAKYLTENADAQSLANLLRYVYANSSALYTFRSYQGVLYPATDLYPSEALYPLGDTLELGGLIRLYDPLWTGLDVNCAIYRKKYTVGKAGATFEALGIGIINMGDASVYKPVAKPIIKPIVGQYPTQKALTTLSDTVDFVGQYGIYSEKRYIGLPPNTWVLNDVGATAMAQLLEMLDRSTITPQEKKQEARRWIAVYGDGVSSGSYWKARVQAQTVGVPTTEMDFDYYTLYEYLFGTPGILNTSTWDDNIIIDYGLYEGLWAELNASIAATNYTISKFVSSTIYERLECGEYVAGTDAEPDPYLTAMGLYDEESEDFSMGEYDGLDYIRFDCGTYETGIADISPNWKCGIHKASSGILIFPVAEIRCGAFN